MIGGLVMFGYFKVIFLIGIDVIILHQSTTIFVV